MVEVVGKVKASHPVYDTPVPVDPHTTVGETLSLMPKRAHGLAVVVQDGQPLGTVSESDAAGVDRFAQAHEVMSTDLLTVDVGTPPAEIFEALTRHHLRAALVLDGERLVGVMTLKHALRSTLYQPALDARGQLMIGAAVGINGDVAGRAEGLLDAGIDILVVDTAHGHQDKMVQALKSVREVRDRQADTGGSRVPLVAGNVVSADGVNDLVGAGADVVKVGVGPGAMCTTRMMTGVGRPQFSAVLECAEAARAAGKSIWADGGVKLPAGRRAGAGRRRRQRDDRFLVRGDVREHRQPDDRRAGPDLQGVLRHGVGAGRAAAHQGRQRVRAGARRPVRGGHLHRTDVPGSGAAQRGGPDRLDRRWACAAVARTPERPASRNSTSTPSSVCSRPPASTRAGRSTSLGDVASSAESIEAVSVGSEGAVRSGRLSERTTPASGAPRRPRAGGRPKLSADGRDGLDRRCAPADAYAGSPSMTLTSIRLGRPISIPWRMVNFAVRPILPSSRR